MTEIALGGGGGLVGDDGFLPSPDGVGIAFFDSTRAFQITGTTDFLRLPSDPNNVNTAIGYRRVDSTGSGGASEWLIDWNAVAAFFTVDAATLASGGYWSGCVIRAGKVYIGFYDGAAAIGVAASYICRADLVTGAIEAVTPIDSTNLASLSVPAQLFKIDSVYSAGFWDVTATGELVFTCGSTTSVRAASGVAVVKMASDYSTVISQEILFDSDQEGTFNWGARVGYFTDDLNVFVTKSGSHIIVGVRGKGTIRFSEAALSVSAGHVLQSLASQYIGGAASAYVGVVQDDLVAMLRVIGPSTNLNGSPKISAKRIDIDAYLKDFVLRSTGVVV